MGTRPIALLLLAACAAAAAAQPALQLPRAQPLLRRRGLLEDAAVCGRFGLPPAAGTDAAPLLAKADADPGSSAIYVERLARTGSRVLTIRSDLRLVKPLVLGAGLTLDVAAGATLRLAAQPVLPKREVFTGRGSVLLEGGRPASPDEFWVLPEWWGAKAGAPASDALERATAACAAVRCTLVLTRPHLLQRPWRLPAGTGVWAGPAAELKGAPGGKGQGVILGPGSWERAGRVALPRLLNFAEWAVKLEDVADLDLYLHNVKWSGTGVLLAPRAAIRRARLQLPVGYELRSYFAVQPEAAGAVLEGVRARSYMSVRSLPSGVVALTRFSGRWAPRLVDTSFENSEVFGGPESNKCTFVHLLNESEEPVVGLKYSVPTWNGQMPAGWHAVKGRFEGLDAVMRLTKDLYGTVSWQGANNTLNWWGLNRLVIKPDEAAAATLAPAPKTGTPPLLTRNSQALLLPQLTTPWPAGATRTFYAYHVLASGATTRETMSVQPWNQARLPAGLRYQNPGLVVEGVEDQSDRVPHQLAITLRNVAKRALTAADFQDARGRDWGLQFRLVIGVRPLA